MTLDPRLGKLYPRSWRERYGPEFDALLEEVQPAWREFTDVLEGAIKMRNLSGTTWLKLTTAMAVAGAIVAAGISFAVPRRYVSWAELRVIPQKSAPDSRDYLAGLSVEVFSRRSLANVIQRLGLYQSERARRPFSEIVSQMRQRDLQIQDEPDGALRISFAYPDPYKSQAVVRALITTFMEANQTRRTAAERCRSQSPALHGVGNRSGNALGPPDRLWPPSCEVGLRNRHVGCRRLRDGRRHVISDFRSLHLNGDHGAHPTSQPATLACRRARRNPA